MNTSKLTSILGLFVLVFLTACNNPERNDDGDIVLRPERELIEVLYTDGHVARRIHVTCINGWKYIELSDYTPLLDPNTHEHLKCNSEVTIIPKDKYENYTREDLQAELEKVRAKLKETN